MAFDPWLDTFAIQGTQTQTVETVCRAVLGQVALYPVRRLMGSFKSRTRPRGA